MLDAQLSKPTLFKKLIDSLREVVTQAHFDCSESGITLQAMDKSHCALVFLKLTPSSFVNFRCVGTLQLGVDLTQISKILKALGEGDSLTIKADSTRNKLTLVISSRHGRKSSNYDLNLLNLERSPVQIPQSTSHYVADVDFSSEQFLKICKHLEPIGDSLRISVTRVSGGMRVAFSVSGPFSEAVINYDDILEAREERNPLRIRSRRQISLEYAIRFLIMFGKGTVLNKAVLLRIASQLPLCVKYDLGDDSALEFFIAPKLAESDEVGNENQTVPSQNEPVPTPINVAEQETSLERERSTDENHSESEPDENIDSDDYQSDDDIGL